MSDRRWDGAVTSLEEIFRSREFGRTPAHRLGAPIATDRALDQLRLEEVFASAVFGHPEAIARAAPLPSPVAPAGRSLVRPPLVLLSGSGELGREYTRHRGAIGAVSGVAAAALAVAGMTSGHGSRSEQPTISAEGVPPGQGSAPRNPVPGHGGVPPANASGPTTGGLPAATAGSGGRAPLAQLTPAAATVAVAAPPSTPVAAVPSSPAAGGVTSPSGPSPSGAGSVLTPVLVSAGTTVSTVGSTVTTASNDLAHAIPAASPVTGLLVDVGVAVTNLGGSVAGR